MALRPNQYDAGKSVISIIKTTTLGGLLVLLPIVAVLALVGTAVANLINIITALAGKGGRVRGA